MTVGKRIPIINLPAISIRVRQKAVGVALPEGGDTYADNFDVSYSFDYDYDLRKV